MAIAAQVIDVAPAPIVIILADIRRLVYFNFAMFIVSALASTSVFITGICMLDFIGFLGGGGGEIVDKLYHVIFVLSSYMIWSFVFCYS